MKNFIVFVLLVIFIFPAFSSGEPKPDFDARIKIKCGTFDPGFLSHAIIPRLATQIDTIKGRPILQKSFLSPSGLFLIHYDTTGIHSVSPEDKNGNGIPDYVDSVAYYFDRAYQVEVDSMGYISPLSDAGLGGSDAYDIYIMDLGNDDVSVANTAYGVTIKDTEKQPRENFPRYVTHIIIDNNFSPQDSTRDYYGNKIRTYSTFGIDALKITAAHEFHHSIQFSYGIENTHITSSMNEMTSVWMEYRLYPDIKDYLQYVKALFAFPKKFPLGDGNPSNGNGYCWSIFPQYLHSQYGDALLLRAWQLDGKGIDIYQAIDSALAEKGSSLSGAWCDFLPNLYYTGDRAKNGQYLADASLMPEWAFTRSEKYTPPAYTPSDVLQSFEVAAFRCILPTQENSSLDTLDVMITNTDLFAAARQYDSNTPITLICSEEPELNGMNLDQVLGSKIYYGVQKTSNNICDKPFFSISYPASYAFPDPFRMNTDKTLNLPVTGNSVLGGKSSVTIYSVDMVPALTFIKDVVIARTGKNGLKNGRVVKIENNDLQNLSNGVYIYQVEYMGQTSIGKFVFKK